ncbi:MAG TPA: tetratricopeptide repeat protein, partial [Hyphomonadaceae bacterium]|nr:tetratricopeptide repeat protein [Hyphomonadaceae bacterium]
MTEDITHLVRQAEAAANAGQWAAAEKLWSDVRRRDPRNPKAAFSLGVHAMQRRDFSTAAALIEEAQRASPRDPFMLLTLSRAKRDAGDEAGEGAAIERALAVDPYFLPALLAKAQRLERIGNASAAAMFFRNAIKVAGAEVMWPEVLRAQLVHARNTAERHARDHHAQLDAALAPMLSSLPRAQAERWREAASVMAGLTEPFHQHANQLHVPRLPAIPFYERSQFPWAAELESKTAVIREEMKAALADGRQDFQPYIKLRPGQPVDQW